MVQVHLGPPTIAAGNVLATPCPSAAPHRHLAPRRRRTLLALGIIGTGPAYVLNHRIITDDGPVLASTVTYLLPVVAVLVGWMVLDEQVHTARVAGVAVVLLGVGLTRRTPMTQLDCSEPVPDSRSRTGRFTERGHAPVSARDTTSPVPTRTLLRSSRAAQGRERRRQRSNEAKRVNRSWWSAGIGPMRRAAQRAQPTQMNTPGVLPSSCTSVAGSDRPQQPHRWVSGRVSVVPVMAASVLPGRTVHR